MSGKGLSIQQPRTLNRVQYVANGDVSKATCFHEVMAQVPRSDYCQCLAYTKTSSVPRIFFRGVSTNSAEDRGQTERGSGCSSPLVRGFTQFVNERNPYSD
jgi:hypothetical protein